MSLQIVMALAACASPSGASAARSSRCGRGRSRSSATTSATGAASTPAGARRATARSPPSRPTVHLDAGAYNYTTNKVLGNCHLSVVGPYEVPNATIDSHGVYTNAVAGRGVPRLRRTAGHLRRRDADEQARRRARARPGRAAPSQPASTTGSVGITQTPFPAGVTMPEVARQLRRRRRLGRAAGATADRRVQPVRHASPPQPAAMRHGPRHRLRVQERRLHLRLPRAVRGGDRAARRRRASRAGRPVPRRRRRRPGRPHGVRADGRRGDRCAGGRRQRHVLRHRHRPATPGRRRRRG